jgi:uroporphyrinogen III methyltransferase/synthase
VDAAIARLGEFDWLVFSSANGVEYFLGRTLATGRDLRALGAIRIAAIGPATAEALRAFHLNADLTPDEFRAEALAEALIDWARSRAVAPRVLLIRASRGREVLAETLSGSGCAVEQVVAYRSVDIEAPDPEIASLIKQGQIDWITVTSSAIARSLVRLFGDDLHRAKLASISPITSATLRELGHEAAAEAREYTMEGIVIAIQNHSDIP